MCGNRWFAVIVGAAVLLSGCQSTDPLFPDGVGTNSLQRGLARRRPVWLDTFPSDSGYYTGVGSAKTGDKGNDMVTARTRAYVGLAAAISTQIRSDVLVSARSDSAGNSFEVAEQIIRETVDQHVQEVQIVDSYYSEADGYWFYVRLDKAVWASIQAADMNRLSERVVSLVEPNLQDDRTTFAARLGTLWKAWSLLMESPYAGIVEGSLLEEDGVLLDLVERRIAGYIDSLSIQVDPAVLRTVPGRPVEIALAVRTNLSLRTGTMNLALADRSSGHRLDVVTDGDGSFYGELMFSGIEPGSHRYAVSLDFGQIGVAPARMGQRILLPEREVLLQIIQHDVFLSVALDDDSGLPNLYGSIASLLTSKAPLRLVSASESEYEIQVNVQSRSAPPNEYDIIIVFTKAVFTVSKDGAIVESYESHEAKDGGLTLFQAQTRSFGKLVADLAEAGDLELALENAFIIE